MSESYPRRDQARGIWKINDITKNIKGDGTYPQAAGQLALFMGGQSPSLQNTIDFINMVAPGDATDFGDLTQATSGGSAMGSFTRGVFAGGNNPGITNVMSYVTIVSAGNALIPS